MIIAIASGKGGTGKTTIAASLTAALADESPLLLDCDVEEPNAALLLKPTLTEREEVALLIPQVDATKCTHCGRCAEVCAYSAIAVVGERTLIFPDLCHGCGSCALQCPSGAIQETPHVIGVIEFGQAGQIAFGQGLLNVGQAVAAPIIRQLKRRLETRPVASIAILDAPPGTSCPVVETLRGADFALLVTEPTPFGLHDLRLAVQTARDELGLPVGVIINRAGVGDDGVERYCAAKGVSILMSVPMDRRIAAAVSEGHTLLEVRPEMAVGFQRLRDEIARRVQEHQQVKEPRP
jgi:MinD superfamily P-loop ATPase